MSKNDQIIKSLDIDDKAKKWILCMSNGFKLQFLFYYRNLGHSLEKSINRAISEIDEIALEKDYRINEIINNENINDCEKLDLIKDLIED
jgi:hypothetical protein